MPRYDARQLVDNIERLIAGTPLSAIPSPRLHALEPSSEEGEDTAGAGEGESQTSTVRALGLSIFPELRRHQQVDKVPPGTRLAFAKRLFMRMLRLVSGPQAAFNYFTVSALDVIAQHLDALRRRQAVLEGLHRKRQADVEVKLAGMHQAVEILETRMTEELLAFRAAVNTTLEQVAQDLDRQNGDAQMREQELAAQMTARVAALSEQLEAKIHAIYQSSFDMVQGVWKGLEERDVQLNKTTSGVQACHSQIGNLETEAREARARLLVLNEQINLHLDVLEKMRRQLESDHSEELRAAGIPLREKPAPPVALPSPKTLPPPSLPGVPAAAAAPAPLPPPPVPAAPPTPLQETASLRLPPAPVESTIPSLEAHQMDLEYLRFQRQYRGDESQLRERQLRYVDLIRERTGTPAPQAGKSRRLLDLACGDGIFLALWREKTDWDALGVDLNQAMARLARNSGIRVEQADAFAYLESGPEKAWDAITSFQFIEHLDKPELIRLLRASKRALKPGGLLLLETLNPHTLIAHKWFHFDLTHKRLIFPEVLALLLESLGYRVLESRSISEVAESERLQLLGDARLQANFDRLNDLLFGKQDYFILAQHP